MAEWLLSVQRDDGSFPEGTGERGDPNVFNTGQAVFGLVEAHRRTGEAAYVDAVRAACDWAVVAQDDDGAWRRYDYEGEVHAYATRVAWALLEGASILDDRAETYRDAARRNLEWALGRRRPNGWFENAAFVDGDDPDLHTIAYTIRGLLEGGVRLDDDELVGAARGSADVLLELQRRTGPLSGTYDADWDGTWYHCLTGNAQMGLVWLRLYELTGEAEYARAARTAAEFLKRHQSLDGPDPVRGAIPGSYPHVGSYLYLRYPNWATKFFADLLAEEDHERVVESIATALEMARERDIEIVTLQEALDTFGVVEAPDRSVEVADTDVDEEVDPNDDGSARGEDEEEEPKGLFDRVVAFIRSLFD
jgi:hypothetical protein